MYFFCPQRVKDLEVITCLQPLCTTIVKPHLFNNYILWCPQYFCNVMSYIIRTCKVRGSMGAVLMILVQHVICLIPIQMTMKSIFRQSCPEVISFKRQYWFRLHKRLMCILLTLMIKNNCFKCIVNCSHSSLHFCESLNIIEDFPIKI